MTSKTKSIEAKEQSLEQQLKFVLVTFFVVFFVVVLWLMLLLSLTALLQVTIFTLIFVPLGIFLGRFYQKIITPFYSLTNLVEAVRLEDYSLRIKTPYQSGILNTLTQEIDTLADDLQQRKQAYDQHTLLIYHLIEQLEAPIAIFNNQLQLSHANEAFSQYIEQPWQAKRLSLSKNLGLFFQEDWHFAQQTENKRWQIKSSQFVEKEQTYHLVILTNVEELLRVNQQKSWQQIIRVLSHEIRNSLTPIKSLAQTLASLESENSQSKQALQVIVDRSVSLQEFVSRYGDISKNIVINKSWFNTLAFVESITTLFPQTVIELEIHAEKIWGDAVLLKQVLINLIKNSLEAGNDNTELCVSLSITSQRKHQQQTIVIEVIDNGQGIMNTDNLFVPFYTTKKQGQGIGLSLSQNIIEQHGGHLTLTNNENKPGATAKIQLLQNESLSA